MEKQKGFSVAKAILAVLWKKQRADTRGLLNHKYLHQLCAGNNRGTYRTAIFRLLKAGFIIKSPDGVFTLSEQGKDRAKKTFIEAETRLHSSLSDWDGGWRMIFFDIPELHRRERDYLRQAIKRIGFKEFQKSIWVYPYPVPAFLKDIFLNDKIAKNTKFLITEAIEDDRELRKLFNLQQINKPHKT